MMLLNIEELNIQQHLKVLKLCLYKHILYVQSTIEEYLIGHKNL